MYNKIAMTNILIIVALSASTQLQAQTTSEVEILTLFTTQQERELINKNRYRISRQQTAAVVDESPQEEKKVMMQ